MAAPSFTRRHYIELAGLVREAGYLDPSSRAQLVRELVALFRADNERFDPVRFVAACGEAR